MLCSFNQLKEWLDAKRDADVERILKERKIPYTYGIGGKPVTTTDAINSVLIDKKTADGHPRAAVFGQ